MTKFLLSLSIFLCLICSASSSLEELSVELMETVLMNERRNDDSLWIVAFTTSKCGHCKKAKQVLRRVARSYGAEGNVHFGTLDCDLSERADALCERFGIGQVPALKFREAGGTWHGYTASMTKESIDNAVRDRLYKMQAMHRLADSRAKRVVDDVVEYRADDEDDLDEYIMAPKLSELSQKSSSPSVVSISNQNWHHLRRRSWIVALVTANCQACSAYVHRVLAPLAERRPEVRIATIDCDQFATLCTTFGIARRHYNVQLPLIYITVPGRRPVDMTNQVIGANRRQPITSQSSILLYQQRLLDYLSSI
jgi:thioredoxin-like negative regulator of GroEL